MFQAPPDSIAERLADRCAACRPVVAGAFAFVLGYLALVVASIAAGVLLVEVVLAGAVRDWDNDVVDWLAKHRTPRGSTSRGSDRTSRKRARSSPSSPSSH